MDKIVISLGGSVITTYNKDDIYLKKLSNLFLELNENYKFIIVCGGGKVSRYYIENGKKLKIKNEEIDKMGIDITRLNAKLLMLVLGEIAMKEIPLKISDAIELFKSGKIVVMGGTEPGQTTDTVASLIAKEIGAKCVINATSVDSLYYKDPKKEKSKKIKKIGFKDFKKLVSSEYSPGKSFVYEPKGIEILCKENIELKIINGRNLKEIKNAIVDGKIRGTIIK